MGTIAAAQHEEIEGKTSWKSSGRFLFWSRIALVTVLTAALYGRVLPALASQWWTDPGASYGLLIPPIALYVAWTRRKLTLAQPVAPDNRGLALILAACLTFLTGQLGAEFFLTRVSLVMLLAGLAWTFWGPARLRTLAFPLILLVTMVPLPAIIYNVLAAPLQLFASRIAAELMQFCGVPVYRDGNIIHLPEISLGVAEACSGLRSLFPLTVLALLIGFLECSRLRSRSLLLALSVPIAIGVNVIRVAGTALLADYNQQLALGFYHSFSGWLIFLVGFAFVTALAKGLHAVLD